MAHRLIPTYQISASDGCVKLCIDHHTYICQRCLSTPRLEPRVNGASHARKDGVGVVSLPPFCSVSCGVRGRMRGRGFVRRTTRPYSTCPRRILRYQRRLDRATVQAILRLVGMSSRADMSQPGFEDRRDCRAGTETSFQFVLFYLFISYIIYVIVYFIILACLYMCLVIGMLIVPEVVYVRTYHQTTSPLQLGRRMTNMRSRGALLGAERFHRFHAQTHALSLVGGTAVLG
ncbi:hypothetical protein B0I35DRAFT_51706 [Stachybotrys elegans]|uniref:Uncharacterized protein n=1 Tax=Stachybotrys elegans TaxID=80388 RepID=A0A8K0SLZ6_9HYPO|nr:hypothetical protein B0I35DRAFT_51706 [Stachybotrys elegans]